MFRRLLSAWIIVSFLSTLIIPVPRVHADELLGLPVPGAMVNLSNSFEPVLIKGLKVHPENPFLFDFIIDTGNSDLKAQDSQLKAESSKLIKYFLASLTVPEKDLWVNLSPYEKDRMIAPNFGQTEMGRDMLAEDYILKQLTASLIYPEKNLGRTFWDKVYAKAQKFYGTTQVPVNTFNKVWIVADRADVFERGNAAYVVGAHLKVMLEEDYMALSRHSQNKSHSIASRIIRQIILPQIEKEVNTGKNFAPLRQMFYSMILASWYKMALKDAILTQIYGNQSKVKVGINQNDPRANEAIFQRYLKAYKKGVFNFIKEDYNPAVGQNIPRKYFSGGTDFEMLGNRHFLNRITNAAQLSNDPFATKGKLLDAVITVDPAQASEIHKNTSPAMTTAEFNPPLVNHILDQLDTIVRDEIGNEEQGSAILESIENFRDNYITWKEGALERGSQDIHSMLTRFFLTDPELINRNGFSGKQNLALLMAATLDHMISIRKILYRNSLPLVPVKIKRIVQANRPYVVFLSPDLGGIFIPKFNRFSDSVTGIGGEDLEMAQKLHEAGEIAKIVLSEFRKSHLSKQNKMYKLLWNVAYERGLLASDPIFVFDNGTAMERDRILSVVDYVTESLLGSEIILGERKSIWDMIIAQQGFPKEILTGDKMELTSLNIRKLVKWLLVFRREIVGDSAMSGQGSMASKRILIFGLDMVAKGLKARGAQVIEKDQAKAIASLRRKAKYDLVIGSLASTESLEKEWAKIGKVILPDQKILLLWKSGSGYSIRTKQGIRVENKMKAWAAIYEELGLPQPSESEDLMTNLEFEASRKIRTGGDMDWAMNSRLFPVQSSRPVQVLAYTGQSVPGGVKFEVYQEPFGVKSRVAKEAVDIITANNARHENSVFIFFTGKRGEAFADSFVQLVKEHGPDFLSRTSIFYMDEYFIGKRKQGSLPWGKDPRSYEYFTQKNLINPLNSDGIERIKKEQIHVINGETDDPQKAIQAYIELLQDALEAKARSAGKTEAKIDMLCGGSGSEGHMAFIERAIELMKHMDAKNFVELRNSNKFFFNPQVSDIEGTIRFVLEKRRELRNTEQYESDLYEGLVEISKQMVSPSKVHVLVDTLKKQRAVFYVPDLTETEQSRLSGLFPEADIFNEKHMYDEIAGEEELSFSTIIQNYSDFVKEIDDMTGKALTIKYGIIKKAARVRISVFGEKTTNVIGRLSHMSAFSPTLPLSVLLNHSDAIFISDTVAAQDIDTNNFSRQEIDLGESVMTKYDLKLAVPSEILREMDTDAKEMGFTSEDFLSLALQLAGKISDAPILLEMVSSHPLTDLKEFGELIQEDQFEQRPLRADELILTDHAKNIMLISTPTKFVHLMAAALDAHVLGQLRAQLENLYGKGTSDPAQASEGLAVVNNLLRPMEFTELPDRNWEDVKESPQLRVFVQVPVMTGHFNIRVERKGKDKTMTFSNLARVAIVSNEGNEILASSGLREVEDNHGKKWQNVVFTNINLPPNSSFHLAFLDRNGRIIRAGSRKDKAELSRPVGGIDLNSSHMQINVRKQGQGVQMQFDPAMLARIKREGFDGLDFKIQSILPVTDLPYLLGLTSK